MKRCLAMLALCIVSLPAMSEQVVDDFESGNPNQWIWPNLSEPLVKPEGGNPGAWLDSGVEYFATFPTVTSVPPVGSPLQVAIASGALHSLRFDFKRLDAGNCSPVNTDDEPFVLTLTDAHTSPGSFINARTAVDETPIDVSDWQTHEFFIPAASITLPDGWVIDGAPDDYTWTDLLANIDAISIFAVDPDSLSHRTCWRLGVDNIVVTYGDAIFVDGFDAESLRRPR